MTEGKHSRREVSTPTAKPIRFALSTLVPAALAAQIMAPSAAATEAPSAAQLQTWRQNLNDAARPKGACYEATYPDPSWHEKACKKAVQKPSPPKRVAALRPDIVGAGGLDWIVEGTIFDGGTTDFDQFTSAEGSFDAKTTVTNECNVTCNTFTDVCAPNLTCKSSGAEPNTFSLQLNTNFFFTKTCAGAPSASCQGWQQFVYQIDGATASMGIQYWLVGYAPYGSKHCPSGYSLFPYQSTAIDPKPQIDCYQILAWDAPAATAKRLAQIHLTGKAGVGGDDDSVSFAIGASATGSSGENLFPDLDAQWWNAEFNLFGVGNNSQAVFDKGSTVIPTLSVQLKTKGGAVSCFPASFTGETNNLGIGKAQTQQPTHAKPAGALDFNESDPAPSSWVSPCGLIDIP